jgi:predicted DNA-binding transcriptional regulator YafY
VHEAKQIRRQVFVHGRAKTANEKIYYNVDRIHQAISGNKQISFRYFKYDAGKKKRYQHNGELYMASPYALSWSEDNYYMVSYTGKYQNATHYRVDKMESIVLLDTPREPLPNRQTFDLGRYMARTFGMFTGEVQTVVLRCDSSMADQMLDRFGMRASIYQTEEDTFDLIADVMISPNFFRWLFGYGTKIRVISPEPVVEEYRLCLRDVARIYSGESKD